MLPTMFTSLESITVSELIEQLHSEAEQRDYEMVSQAEMDVSEKEIASKTEVNTSGTGTLIMSIRDHAKYNCPSKCCPDETSALLGVM